MSTESQLASLQRDVGRLEGMAVNLREDLASFRSRYEERGKKVDATHDDVLEVKRLAIILGKRLDVLEQRNWNGGLNGKTWATLFTTLGVIATAVSVAVVAALK